MKRMKIMVVSSVTPQRRIITSPDT